MGKKGLGKGLGALITKTSEAKASEDKDKVINVSLDQIFPSPLQPRKTFKEEQLNELKESIREHGIIQPLIVRKSADNRYELIAGERRWRASQLLGLATAPIFIREATDQEMLEMALIENLQRADLDAIEEARGYERLSSEFKLKQSEIATRVGKSRATVANAVRLLNLPETIQGYLSNDLISVGHAKALLAVKEPKAQKALSEMVIKQKLTVRAVEKMAKSFTADEIKKTLSRKKDEAESSAQKDPIIRHLERLLQDHLASRVKIMHQENKGRIEIEYYGNDDLHRVLEAIGVKLN